MQKNVRLAAVTLRCPIGDTAANLAKAASWAKKAASRQARVVLFPELNLTGYSANGQAPALTLDSPECREIARLAKTMEQIILCGLAEAGANGQVFASHLAAFPDGSTAVYRKTHLSAVEEEVFTPGDQVPVFSSGNFCFGIQLCYDAHFPGLSTAMALAGAHALFMPHASPRGKSREKEESWMRHLSARAFDNGVYVAAVNQAGDNGGGLSFPGLALVLDPMGKIIARCADGEGMAVADLKASALQAVRKHRMAYFLNRSRPELYAAGAVCHHFSGAGKI